MLHRCLEQTPENRRVIVKKGHFKEEFTIIRVSVFVLLDLKVMTLSDGILGYSHN